MRAARVGWRRAAIVCVLVAHVLLLAAMEAIPNPYATSSPFVVAHVGIEVAQVSLLSIWVGLGAGRWLPRVALAWLISLVPTALSVRLVAPVSLVTWLRLLLHASLFFVPVMLAVVVPLVIARQRGWRLVPFAPGTAPRSRPWQFSVRHLLLVATVVAVVLAFAHYMQGTAQMQKGLIIEPARTPIFRYVAAIYGVWGLRFVIGPLLAVWASLTVGAVPVRLVVAGLVASALAALPPYCFDGTGSDYLCSIGMGLVQMAIVVGTLLVFRGLNYRLVWTRQAEEMKITL